ncbi:hypothetical protein, partial [Burkholderia ambifaria]|uniref:hypothetical protein n=1 Tax=Burkholderia ambifaria TaxID=152480 RepID=UPI00158D1B58
VPDTVARLRLALLAPVPSHLLEAKNRESTQEPESLTGGGGPIVVRKRQSPLARPIYATTPYRLGISIGRLFRPSIPRPKRWLPNQYRPSFSEILLSQYLLSRQLINFKYEDWKRLYWITNSGVTLAGISAAAWALEFPQRILTNKASYPKNCPSNFEQAWGFPT